MTPQNDDTPPSSGEQEATAEETAAALDAFDLDHDGKISLVEDIRAEIGLVDARLEALAAEHGVKGKLAEGAHRILDKLDND